MFRQIHHYTLHTGHGRLTDRSEVADEVIDLLRPICDAGGGDLPGPWGWRLVVTPGDHGGWLCSVCRGDAPLVSFGVATTQAAADEVWPHLLELARLLKLPTSQRQPPLPWISAVFLLGQATCDQEQASALADLERCVAWTLSDDATH